MFYLTPTYRKIRQKEASKFHVQLCIAIFCMFFFFLVGIDRTESEVGCTIFSLLIQYFTMASVALMGAEAVLMFHRLIIVFGRMHLAIVSVIAWGDCLHWHYLQYCSILLSYSYCIIIMLELKFTHCINLAIP